MVKITPIIPSTLALQTFAPEDFSVIPNTIISSEFNPGSDYIEYFVYDYNNILLTSDTQLTSFTPSRLDNKGNGTIVEINLNPEQDAVNAGYDSGIVKTIYNFVKYHLGSSPGAQFYISEISPSRTEIRLNTNQITNFDITDFSYDQYPSTSEIEAYKNQISLFFTEFKQQLLEDSTYFDEFYLNLGDNLYLLAINAVLDIDLDNKLMSLLIKLYEPLPSNINLKSELYIVTKPAESVGYQLEFEQVVEVDNNITQLSGPNYNIDVKDQTGPTTIYKTYTDITQTTLSGSFSELMGNISQSSITLNTDYTEYDNFVFFSSAKERLQNFKSKLISIRNNIIDQTSIIKK